MALKLLGVTGFATSQGMLWYPAPYKERWENRKTCIVLLSTWVCFEATWTIGRASSRSIAHEKLHGVLTAYSMPTVFTDATKITTNRPYHENSRTSLVSVGATRQQN